MKMAEFQGSTVHTLEKLIRDNRLDALVDVKNPMDINPAANDRLHAETARVLAEDDNVDGVVVGLDPLSPAMQTLPAGVREGEAWIPPAALRLYCPKRRKAWKSRCWG